MDGSEQIMGSRREDVDLELVLKDPQCARHWVLTFDWDTPDPPDHIIFDRGLEWERTIYFKNMTDEEAVIAAKYILQNFEIIRATQELYLLDPDRSVH